MNKNATHSVQQVVVATTDESQPKGGVRSAPLSPQGACAERRDYIARKVREARKGKSLCDRYGFDDTAYFFDGIACALHELVKAGHAPKDKQARGDNGAAQRRGGDTKSI